MTALFESLFLKIIHDVFSVLILAYLHFSQVRKPILDSHVTLGSVQIPVAVGVHSDHGFGHNLGCNGKRPMGHGQV